MSRPAPLDYETRAAPRLAALLRRAHGLRWVVLLMGVCGTLGGWVGYLIQPVPMYTHYWVVELTDGPAAPGDLDLTANFHPSRSFAPVAVNALRRSGVGAGLRDDEIFARTFMFARKSKSPPPISRIEVGFDAANPVTSAVGAQVLATEVSAVLEGRGIHTRASSLQSWGYDDGGGAVPRVAFGTTLGALLGCVVLLVCEGKRRDTGGHVSDRRA